MLELQAPRLILADPSGGLEAGDPGVGLAIAPDTKAGMASTTESFTLLLAVEAVEAGYVDLDDLVEASENAAGINGPGHGGGHSNIGLVAGQQYRFENLLYALILASAGDASIAIAEHVAVSTYPDLADATAREREDAFTLMMNVRATELGLNDSSFFNAYGGDHAHDLDNSPMQAVPHETTVRDMIKWFHEGMQHPLYRAVVGYQGPGYNFGPFGGFVTDVLGTLLSYPGEEGTKGGNNGASAFCTVGQAELIGRELLVAYTGNVDDNGDGAQAYDWGFSSLFYRRPQGAGSSNVVASKHALSCAEATRAASAYITVGGQPDVLLWDVNLPAETLTPIGVVDDILIRPGSGDGIETPGLKTIEPDDPEPILVDRESGDRTFEPTLTGDVPTMMATDITASYAGNGNLTVAVSSNLGVWLYSWGIPAMGEAVLRDTVFVGDGDMARVQALEDDLILTAHRGAADQLVLTTWGLDKASGELTTNALDTEEAPWSVTSYLDLAARRRTALWHRAFLSMRSVLSSFRAAALRVRTDGLIELGGIIDEPVLRSRMAATAVPGFGPTREIFALAHVVENTPRLKIYEVAADGSLTELAGAAMDGAGTSLSPMYIAPYATRGVMVARTFATTTTLDVWALDPEPGGDIQLQNIMTEPTHPGGEPAGLCRVPAGYAEGDFLLANLGEMDSRIRLGAWRSGQRF